MAEINLDQIWISIIVVIFSFIWISILHTKRKTIKSSATQTNIKAVTVIKSITTQTNLNLKSSATQTSYTATHCAQTETMKFTERLTNYGDRNVDSSEIFDNCCDICEQTEENEAVGFCQECEKFMCLKCCKHHEKIPVSDNHILIGKENLNKAKQKKTLFEKVVFPIQNYSLSNCALKECKPTPQTNCNKHVIQPIGLTCDIPCVTTSIGCFTMMSKHSLSIKWKSPGEERVNEQKIPGFMFNIPADFCTVKQHTPDIHFLLYTVPNENKVKVYELKRKSKKDNRCIYSYLYTDGECYGIASFNEGLAISVYIPTSYSLPKWQVQFTDLNGTVRKRICYDNKGQALFKEAKHLTSNEAQDVLYVSDQGHQAVIALDIKDNLLFKFTHETIKSPLGLTCDEEGNIYVASGNKVIQINKYGTKSRIVLSSNEQEPKELVDVCFHKHSNMLGVVNKSAEVTILNFLE